MRLLGLTLIALWTFVPAGGQVIPETFYPRFILGPISTIPGDRYHYAYEATALLNGSDAQIWWCGDYTNGYVSPPVGDSIFYSHIYYNANAAWPFSGGFSAPQAVLAWNGNYAKGQKNIACSPSVVRVPFDATYPYRMFFECTTATNSIQSNICTAKSSDGVNWSVWTGPAKGWVSQVSGVATPIIYTAAGSTGYGIGHPSAIVIGNTVFLYFFYQPYAGTTGYMYLDTTTDGINFQSAPPGSQTSLPFPAHVYLVNYNDGAGHTGTFYLATFGAGTQVGPFAVGNYCIFSLNGLNFVFVPQALDYVWVPCGVAPPAFLTDTQGHIALTARQGIPQLLFTSEGQFPHGDPDDIPGHTLQSCYLNGSEIQRGSTWNILAIPAWVRVF